MMCFVKACTIKYTERVRDNNNCPIRGACGGVLGSVIAPHKSHAARRTPHAARSTYA